MSSENNNFFELVYRDTNTDVLKYIVAKCNNMEDVSDIFQDVYMEFADVLKKRGSQYFKNPKAFLLHLTKTKIHRFYKSSLSYIENNIEDISKEVDIENINITVVEDEVITNEQIDKALSLIGGMDMLTQRILYLRFYVDCSLDEISKSLNINESTIKSRLYRALRYLKDKMEE